MKAIQATLAAAVLAASGLASAAPAFEGGQASAGLTFEPQAGASQRDRADVAAEARAAVRNVDSRSGQQYAAEANKNAQPVASDRTRAQVRAEAASARSNQVFEGGQAA